jgi:hypothetical protein
MDELEIKDMQTRLGLWFDRHTLGIQKKREREREYNSQFTFY